MQILISHLGVSINDVFRPVNMTSLPLDIVNVFFDTQKSLGSVNFDKAPAQQIGAKVFNQLYQRYIQDWNAAGTPPSRTLQMVKLDKRTQINSIRDNLEQAGFAYMGKMIDSNPVSVQRITVAVQAAQAAAGVGQLFSIDWTTQDNSTLTLNAMAMLGMPVALAIFARDLHGKARIKKQLIDAATSIEAVEAVTW